MAKSILITGIAGSGKSSICRELNARGFRAYDIEDMTELFSMREKGTGAKAVTHDNNDLESVKRHEWICDIVKLKELIDSHQNEGDAVFYCGVASNTDELIPLFQQVILLKASPDTIRKRLSSRTRGEFGGAPAVQEWVLSWKDWWESRMQGAGAFVIAADRSPQDVTNDILERVL